MRNQKHKLERIDIDELFSSPVNRGMLSFLERPPEEAQVRLREKQKLNAIDASRMTPVGDLPTGQEKSAPNPADPVGNLPPGSELQLSEQAAVGFSTLPRSQDEPHAEWRSAPDYGDGGVSSEATTLALGSQLSPTVESHPEGKSPCGQLSPGGNLPRAEWSDETVQIASQEVYPEGNLPPGLRLTNPTDWQRDYAEKQIRPKKPHAYGDNPKHPLGKVPPGLARPHDNRQAVSRTPSPEAEIINAAQPEVIDGSVIGRRQRVRRAIVAQDGHSSGEQLLYQALWNAGSAETPETRLLSIGYSGMSTLCKLEKSNCKKNVLGLVQKLAVEVTESHQSVNSTGTTYRIFSYKEILRRRESAGMVWVVRTSGVRFVNPLGNSPPAPAGELPSGAVGELPPPPVGSLTTGAGGVLPIAPVGEIPTHIGIDRKEQERLLTSSSENIGQLCSFARSQIAEFDDDACRLLWERCKDVAPDCTLAEVIYCFDLKAHQLLNERTRNVANPVGLMIWSVPKMFEGSEALYLQRRRAKAEEEQRSAEDISQFEQNRANWRALLDNPSVSEEDRGFYRKLLGDSGS